jgi:hypothetical protein
MLTLLWLSMAGIAPVVLLVWAAALLATMEFVYRHLISAPITWLISGGRPSLAECRQVTNLLPARVRRTPYRPQLGVGKEVLWLISTGLGREAGHMCCG